jgi:hypothetical protein
MHMMLHGNDGVPLLDIEWYAREYSSLRFSISSRVGHPRLNLFLKLESVIFVDSKKLFREHPQLAKKLETI